MEYEDTRIHKNEEVMAKTSPKASTLNPNSTPGNGVKNMHLIIFPSSMTGTMEITIKNCSTLASIVQPSLMFGHLPNKIISIDAIAGHKIAITGLKDSTSAIMMLHTLLNRKEH